MVLLLFTFCLLLLSLWESVIVLCFVVHSSIAIILMGKRELVALLNLSSWCLVMVERLFLTMPRGCLRFAIVVFPDHTLLLFFTYQTIYYPPELLLPLLSYIPHLLIRLFTTHWLCYCPDCLTYYNYSQDYLPNAGSVTILTALHSTSTHTTIYHPLFLLVSLLTYTTFTHQILN